VSEKAGKNVINLMPEGLKHKKLQKLEDAISSSFVVDCMSRKTCCHSAPTAWLAQQPQHRLLDLQHPHHPELQLQKHHLRTRLGARSERSSPERMMLRWWNGSGKIQT